MPKVTFLVDDRTFECDAEAGDTLLEIALAGEVPMRHACGGNCLCTTCRVEVDEGEDALSPMASDEEAKLSGFEGGVTPSRLSCQTCVEGDVIVRVMNPS